MCGAAEGLPWHGGSLCWFLSAVVDQRAVAAGSFDSTKAAASFLDHMPGRRIVVTQVLRSELGREAVVRAEVCGRAARKG